MPASAYDIATHLLDAGLSLIPIRESGSKRPACSWKAYQTTLPTHEDLSRWFEREGYEALAVVCGAVSGAATGASALECIDFDDPAVFPEWRGRVSDFAPELAGRLVITETPSGGRHVWYRYDLGEGRAPDGNDKLATSADGDVRIETRGDGGYALIPSSPGYKMRQGKFTALPELGPGERDLLLHVAQSYDKAPVEEKKRAPAEAGGAPPRRREETSDPQQEGERPGDEFDRTGWPRCRQLLKERGWTLLHTRSDGTEEWRRPGKKEKALSATYGHATGRDGGGRFYVFSTNTRRFEPEETYSPFAVYAELEFGGDFSAAGRALAEEGYGSQPERKRRRQSAQGAPGGDGAPGPPPDSAEGREDSPWPYGVDQAGRLVYHETYKTRDSETKRVADFSARIRREIRTEGGDLHFELAGQGTGGRPFHTEISAPAFEEPRRLASTLREAVGGRARIYPRMRQHLPPAIISVSASEGVEEITRYERTGWTASVQEGVPRFLIPGRAPEGTEIEVQGLPYEHAPPPPPGDEGGEGALLEEGRKALEGLLTAHAPKVGTVLVSHLLVPPLARRAGLSDHRYALLAHGLSGSLKTSWAMAGMCLWGRGFSESKHLIKWGQGTTSNALITLASQAHDLPFLIDNYKRSTGRGAGDFIDFIHSALEGGEKRRLNRMSNLKDQKDLRTWPLATGEDVPDTDPATLARMLVVRLSWESGGHNEGLQAAQERPEALEELGRRWLGFLESEAGAEEVRKMAEAFEDRRAAWAKELRASRRDMVNPLRVASSLALNDLGYEAARSCDALAPALAPYAEAHAEGLSALAGQMASYGGESREAHRYLEALDQAISSGRAAIKPLGKEPAGYETEHFIGWDGSDTGEDVLYLLPGPAREAAEEMLAARGADLGGISERSLYAQLEDLGAFCAQGAEHTAKQKWTAGKNHRCLWLRRSLFFSDEAGEDGGGHAGGGAGGGHAVGGGAEDGQQTEVPF